MRELEYPFDGEYLLRKKRSLRKELLAGLNENQVIEKRIAVLGGSTTNEIKVMLELFLLGEGIRPVFYESEYNRYYEDAMFPGQELLDFAPEIVWIHTTGRNISRFPSLSDSEEEIDRLLEEEYARFEAMWEALGERWGCIVIQNNFEYPDWRLLGNLDQSDVHGRVSFVLRLNQKWNEYARAHENFYIHDIHYLSARYGLDRWSDPFYWHMYKCVPAVPAIPDFAFSLSRIIKALLGKNKKALALDLDNTLWGGVVGDDGVENLELGQETSVGQAYTEFQSYLRQYRQLGIVLGVISKNDEENALAGLLHEAGILRPDDFISIKANWEPKDRNLVQMAQELSLLPESFVFADDNPAEREIVRQSVPGAGIAELDKPEYSIRAIDRAGYFEPVTLSEDDLRRTRMYEENVKRTRLQSAFTDYHDYLLSLGMKAHIATFEPVHLARIAQLTNKSNQFNLTTRRFTQGELERIAADGQYITLAGSLEDRFGDNGIVSVVIGRKESKTLHIDLWLMSCRVLKRDMERAMLDELAERALREGMSELAGYYYKTAKNGMVSDFYKEMGFELLTEQESGDKTYRLVLGDVWERQCDVIELC